MAFKRNLLLLGILVLLGALTTVGVAWGAAAWHYVGRATRDWDTTALGPSGVSLHRASYRSKVALRVNSAWGVFELPPGEAASSTSQELHRIWGPIVGPEPIDDPAAGGARAFDARGWPMLCMWSALDFKFSTQQTNGRPVFLGPGKVLRVINGIELAPYRQFRTEAPQHKHCVLPLGIVWSGFAVNSVLFATVGLCLLTAVRQSRRALRAGAGRCPVCAYDLRETVHDQCPECGFARQTRTGSTAARRLRRAVIGAWAAVGVVVMITVVASLGPWMTQVNWDAYTPSTWLRWKAESPDLAKSASALEELITRISDGKLTDETTESLVRHALAVQADTTQPWLPQWGDIVVTARTSGSVTDEDWQTFAQQAIVPELLVRSTVVQGDPVAARLRLHRRAPSVDVLVASVQPVETRLGDNLIHMGSTMSMPLMQLRPTKGQPERVAFYDFHFSGTNALGWSMRSRTSPTPEFELGTCVLETSWYIMVAEGTMASGQIQYFTDDVIFDAEFSLQATIEVLAAGAETVELVCDDSLRGAIKESLDLRSFRISPASRPSVVSGWFEVVEPPMDFAFDVFVSVGEREWLVGQVDSEVDGQTGLGRMFSRWVTDLDRDRVDLILRPSRSTARRTLGITRIWDGEIIIEDVAPTPGR